MLNIKQKIDTQLDIEYDAVLVNVAHLFRKGNIIGIHRRFANIGGGVYVIYSNVFTVIYIGTSKQLKTRLRKHVKGSLFTDEIMFIGIVKTESYDRFRAKHSDCGDIEYYLIEKVKPKYNTKTNEYAATHKIEKPTKQYNEETQHIINSSMKTFSVGEFKDVSDISNRDEILVAKKRIIEEKRKQKETRKEGHKKE